MPERIDYLNLFLGLGSTLGVGYLLGSGKPITAAIWSLAAFIGLVFSLGAFLKEIDQLQQRVQEPTAAVRQLAKSDGEIELEVTSQ